MQGLTLTYETLGASRNEAAVDVLVGGLGDDNASTRRSSLAALLSRSEPRAPEMVLANWHKLLADDMRVLRPKKKWMVAAIKEALKGDGALLETAIEAAEALFLTDVMPQLILLAESCASREIKRRAGQAVLKICEPLGDGARGERDHATVRGPIQNRLADSVRRFSMHRNLQLVDAFLVVSSWGDGAFRQMFTSNTETLELILSRLRDCELSSVTDLLAGFIRRRKLHEGIAELILTREDESFRNALLRRVGAEPSATALRNLQELGMPASMRGGEAVLVSLSPEQRAPFVHIYAVCCPDRVDALHVIAAAVERGGPGCIEAAIQSFNRCEVPATEFWMRAAIPVADGDMEIIQRDPNARLLKRLIDLLDCADGALTRAVRRVLEPLHARNMIERFETLRPRSRRRLGRVVMTIDPDAIARTRDALRHPVLKHRLSAIAMADALVAVDLLADSFKHIAHEDHLEARVRAAEAMATAEGPATLDLLQELMLLPECPVRDAAAQALQKRTAAGMS